MQPMNLINFFSNINPKDVLKYLPDAVLVVNEQSGEIIWINEKAANIFEIIRDEMEHLKFDDIVNMGMKLAEQSSTKNVPVIGGAVAGDKEFFVEMNASLIEEEYFITVRDVTAMTNVLVNAERTGRLNKDKNIMLSKLSGEFKSPIQSIIGFSQALGDGLGGEINEKQAKYVKIINKNAVEALYFMEKFLEYSQVESSLVDFEYQVFDIENTVKSVIKANENSIKAKNLTVSLSTENLSCKTVYSDMNAIKSIVQNILETSIKLTETGAIIIELSTPAPETVEQSGVKLIKNAQPSSYLMITILDNGIGLQESELEGIFEPYTQLDKLNKKNIIRSLSLGTAKELVKQLNGAIGIKTEIMKGTVFNIILPVEKGAIQQNE